MPVIILLGRTVEYLKNATLDFEIKYNGIFTQKEHKEMHKTFNTTQLQGLSTLLAPPRHSFKSSFVYSSGTHPAQGWQIGRHPVFACVPHNGIREALSVLWTCWLLKTGELQNVPSIKYEGHLRPNVFFLQLSAFSIYTLSCKSWVMVGLSEETSINTASVEMVGHKSLCKLIRADNNFELTRNREQ